MLRMTLEIRDPDTVDAIARRAEATGMTPEEVVASALRLSRAWDSAEEDPSVDEVLSLVRSFHLQPTNEQISDDEILGYDK